MASYTLLAYSEDNLAIALSGKIGDFDESAIFTTPEEVKEKKHFSYLAEYLSVDKGIKAATIVVEHNYISKDYLVDFASYYASCFDNYSKTCNRLHFFSIEFDEENFDKAVLKHSDEGSELWKSYLGYIIAKPIPLKIIGKTVLATYPVKDSESERIYFGNRIYDINIFGNNVKINSLAFMEQDGVVSVCATSAIWMMLQKASCNSYATLKTPSEITDEADIVGTHGERLFPNKGLSVKQISKSIYHSGLVSEIRTEKNVEQATILDNSYLKRIVNAYSLIGIPLILVLKVPFKNNGQPHSSGFHAITITGFKVKKHESGKFTNEINWHSESISKLFAHDDGWGPFSRLDFGAGRFDLINNWSKSIETLPPSRLTDIIIPVYHKIRISYDDVELIVISVDKMLRRIYLDKAEANISWNIRLNYSERYKSCSKNYPEHLVSAIHFRSMPKYIWIAECYLGDLLLFEMIFDATDVAIGMFGFAIYFHNATIKKHIHESLEMNPGFLDFLHHPSKSQFFAFLKNESLDVIK